MTTVMSAAITAHNEQPLPPSGCVHTIRAFLQERHSSVTDHVQSQLATIHAIDTELGAFVSVAEATAIRDAEAADRLIATRGAAAWEDRPLLGITIAVKDLIQTGDLPTTRGSLLMNHRAQVDAPAVARLRAAGAIVIGKTVTSEYGWSASTASRVAGPARNPWDRDRSAGGSSGGSAAAVASGLCTAALGTDGAGSIRIPAAFCGVVGFKPSFGRVPYVPPCADRLAHLGPLTRCVSDAIELTRLIAGAHPGDPNSRACAPGSRWRPEQLRIGWLEFGGTAAAVRQVSERALASLAGRGHRLDRIEVPFADPYPALVDILASAEASGTDPADEELCDPGRVAIARHGRTITGASVMLAEEKRLELRTRLLSVMERYDVLAMATVPIEPFGVDALGPPWADGLSWLAWTPATYPFNMTGQPAVSLPAGVSPAGLPVGLQLVGPCGGDDLVLHVAAQIEAELGVLPLAPGAPGPRDLMKGR
jgi:aspartyl-tRNA(Asn)/glutamyl-tRNA(Gln) amidotransferase subunit A